MPGLAGPRHARRDLQRFQGKDSLLPLVLQACRRSSPSACANRSREDCAAMGLAGRIDALLPAFSESPQRLFLTLQALQNGVLF